MRPDTRRLLSARTGTSPVAAALAVLALAAGSVSATPAEDRTGSASEQKTVSYHGYQLQVPASWPVIHLNRHPRTCVRFDRHAVYLGTPSGQMDCPSGLTGRTTALLIEPLTDRSADRPGITATGPDGAVPATTRSMGSTVRVAVEDAGVLVTATHGTTGAPAVRRMLASAELTSGGTPRSLERLRTTPPRTRAAAVPVQPGNLTGKGFDACAAPSQAAMDAWRSSPYKAVGVYISGVQRACAQPHLTASWVRNQTANGWHLIPIEVGMQAPCNAYENEMSSDPATARAQGADAATSSAAAAENLGIPQGSVLYNDMEGYSRGGSCSAAVLSYLSGWTEKLHQLGYLSGVYSSAGSGMVDLAENHDNPDYVSPDHIWFAWWNGRADTDAGPYVPDDLWAEHQRIHQYSGGHNETHGGVTINIDSDYLDVREGTPPEPSECRNVGLDFDSYTGITSGASGDQVEAAQCLLKDRGLYDPEPPTGTYDQTTVTAVEAFQAEVGLPESGEIDASTWTALLSAGTTPLLQEGSSGAAVSRVQRSLVAALGRTIGIDGQFGPETDQAVRDYQDSRDLGVDGIVGPNTWNALQSGR